MSIAVVGRDDRGEVRVGEGCKVFQIGVVCVSDIGRKRYKEKGCKFHFSV